MVARSAVGSVVVGVLAMALPGLAPAGETSSPVPSATSRAEARVELGRRLFFDPVVSRTGLRSCSTCHLPAHGFSDPNVHSTDDAGATRRHSQTILYSDLAPGVHWDGEFPSVEALCLARLSDLPRGTLGDVKGLVDGRRMSFATSRAGGRGGSVTPPPTVRGGPGQPYYSSGPTTRPIGPVLEGSGLYDEAFLAAFGSKTVTPERLAEAIAAYVASVRPGEAPYDRFAKGDTSALPDAARRGHDLFRGKAACATCHVMRGPGSSFTDQKFHTSGVAWRAVVADAGPAASKGVKKADTLSMGDVGRMAFSERTTQLRAFKTPTLRDVALRPPYMHDGAFATLREVVEYYADGCSKDPALDKKLHGFEATNAEIDDLVAFLDALTGDTRAGMAARPWPARAARTRIQFLDREGHPVAGWVTHVCPAGDVLPGGDPVPRPTALKADGEGWIEFAPAAWTHTRLLAEGFHDVLVPDTCREAVVRVNR